LRCRSGRAREQTIKEALAKVRTARFTLWTKISRSSIRWARRRRGGGHSKGKSGFGADRIAERRPRLRPDRRAAGGTAGFAARDDHHANRSRRRKMKLKRELEAGWFSAHRMPAAGGALDSVRHQQSALRHAERHHGGEEKDIAAMTRESLGVPLSRRRRSKKSTCRRKQKRQNS